MIGHTRVYWTSSLVNLFGKENIRVVQIGAWNGHETNQIAEMVRYWNGKLIVIDWFKGNISVTDDSDIKYDEDNIEENKKLFWSNIHPDNKKVIDLRVGNSNDLINGFMCGDDYSGDYYLNKISEVSKEDLEQDTIDGFGYEHINGDIIPNIHAGVIKSVYEYFGGNVMFNLPQSKWLHWKKPKSKVGYNMNSYNNGIRYKGTTIGEEQPIETKVDESIKDLPAFGSEFKK